MSRFNFLTGTKVLEEKESKYSGRIQVIKSLAFGTYVTAGKLTQSGGIVEKIWERTLRKMSKSQFQISNVLILGLGGGSTAKVVRKLWPEAKIIGVDIDPVMIELGKKYLHLDDYKVQVQVQDAQKYLESRISNIKSRYDLICVDLYIGDKFPEKFESDKFLGLVHGLLSKNGIAVFNRTYYDEKRREAMKFGEKLEKVFSKVDYFFPIANLMLISRN
jgi:spermidine synthase